MNPVRLFGRYRASLIAALVVVSFAPTGRAADRVVAGVEVGSKGAKLLVLRVPVPGPAERVLARTLDPTPLADVEPDGSLSVAGVRRTTSAVSELVALARDKHAVPDADLLVVGSSGVATAPNRGALADAVHARTGLRMTFLTPDDEATLLFRGLVPPADRPTAMALDVGSGNTRVAAAGWAPGVGAWHVLGTCPFGTVSLSSVAERDQLRTVGAVERSLRPRVDALADGHPTLTHHRSKCHLTGGAAWALVAVVKPAAVRDAVVPVTTADIASFAELVDTAGDQFPAVDLSAISDPAVRAAATAELARVRDTFTPGNLRSAAALLQVFSQSYRFEQKDVTFRRDGQFAWLLAHLQPDPPPAPVVSPLCPRPCVSPGTRLVRAW